MQHWLLNPPTRGALLAALVLFGCYSTDADDNSPGGGGQAGTTSSNAGTTGDAGAPASGSGGSTSAGGTSAGGNSGGTTTVDPECASADSNGFFSDCSVCGGDCDTIDNGSSTRNACGCSNGCPCGLTCGCFELAPGLNVCDLCVR